MGWGKRRGWDSNRGALAPRSASKASCTHMGGPEASLPGRVGSRPRMGWGKRRGWDSNPHTLARAGFQDRFLSHSDTPPNGEKMVKGGRGINA